MRVFYFVFISLSLGLSGCGVDSSIPSGVQSSPSENQRAVIISRVVQTGTGSVVTCELNEAIVDLDMTVPLFLEYEGTEIQRVNLTNQAEFTFNEYNPPTTGNIVCVVEFADAEFESPARSLDHIP